MVGELWGGGEEDVWFDLHPAVLQKVRHDEEAKILKLLVVMDRALAS